MIAENLRDETAQVINSAFANTPYPGDENVTAYARYGRTIADALRGKHWQDVTLETLVQHRWEIFLLAPETFRYYLPVFMLGALYHYDDLDSLPANVIFSLTPQRQEHINNYFAGEYNDYFSRRAAAFNTPEKAAVVSFLEAFSQLYPPEDLLYDIDLAGNTLAFWKRA
jgi:hypothetical protein